MNKFSIGYIFSLAFALILVTGCSPDSYEWDGVDTASITERHNVISGSSALNPGCNASFSAILRANSTYAWSVNGANATITPSGPGNRFVDIVVDENASVSEVDVVLTETPDFGGSFTTTRTISVVTSLAGSYNATTTYGYHDFLPDYSTNTWTIGITEVAGEANKYQIGDFSGGLYSVGPYATEYGTGADSFTVQFSVDPATGAVTWDDEQGDPWGSVVPTPGGVNMYDEATKTLTISWSCTGYGENGVSVYTFSCG